MFIENPERHPGRCEDCQQWFQETKGRANLPNVGTWLTDDERRVRLCTSHMNNRERLALDSMDWEPAEW